MTLIQRNSFHFFFVAFFAVFAGNAWAQPGAISTVAGPMNGPYSVATDSVGNIYISEWSSHQIRKIAAGSGALSTIAGIGSQGYGGDGGQAIYAALNYPEGVAVDTAGNLYIADSHNNRVRKITAANGIITTIAGTGAPGYNGDGAVTTSQLNNPAGVTVDANGNVYIADQSNHRIRKVTPNGTISTVAGTGVAGFSGDGGPASGAQINNPVHITTDTAGNLYITDYYNNRVRRVNANNGTIETIAGSSSGNVGGFSGDGGPATAAQLTTPAGVIVDSGGNIYIADTGNQRIRRIDAKGVIQTIAGGGTNGDGCLATTSSLTFPLDVALNPSGKTLYIADYGANLVRAVELGGNLVPPILTSLSPSSGTSGTTNSVTLSGSGFSIAGGNSSCNPGPTTVSISGAGVTVSGINVVNDSSISLILTIAAGAGTGTRNITVTNANGTSNAIPFTVTAPTPAPAITAISPASAVRGATVTVTLTGSNFDPKSGGTTMSLGSTGITISVMSVASSTSMTATFLIDANAATGQHTVTVSTSRGTSNSAEFDVNALPTITGISPATGLRGANAAVTISGANFDLTSGSTQIVVGNGITASNLQVNSTSSLTVTLTVDSNATLGNHGISVSTSVGSSNTMEFAVDPPGPSFTYGLPATLDPTQQAPLQLTMTAPSPDTVSGELTFTFAPNAATTMDDPNITFINAQTSTRSVNFTIPPNETTAQFAISDAVLQVGTVAGTIQLRTDQVQVAGQSVIPASGSFDVTVPRMVPTITNVRILNRTAKGFDVEITGFSDSKDISLATFDFKAASGTKLETVQLQPDVAAIFAGYYQSADEPMAGGTFVYTQPFIARQGSANVVAAVTVTLSNAQGASQPRTAP